MKLILKDMFAIKRKLPAVVPLTKAFHFIFFKVKNSLLYYDETMSVNKNEICSHYLDLKIQCSVRSIFFIKKVFGGRNDSDGQNARVQQDLFWTFKIKTRIFVVSISRQRLRLQIYLGYKKCLDYEGVNLV